MKNLEVPLYLIAHYDGATLDADVIAEAHSIYSGLEEHEYHKEAPDLQKYTVHRLFTELEGPTWEERQEQIDIDHQVEQLPKCLDIALAIAGGGNIDKARWLIENMIEYGILHEPSSQHREFFERADIQQEAFEQIAEAKAANRRDEAMRNLQEDN